MKKKSLPEIPKVLPCPFCGKDPEHRFKEQFIGKMWTATYPHTMRRGGVSVIVYSISCENIRCKFQPKRMQFPAKEPKSRESENSISFKIQLAATMAWNTRKGDVPPIPKPTKPKKLTSLETIVIDHLRKHGLI